MIIAVLLLLLYFNKIEELKLNGFQMLLEAGVSSVRICSVFIYLFAFQVCSFFSLNGQSYVKPLVRAFDQVDPCLAFLQKKGQELLTKSL